MSTAAKKMSLPQATMLVAGNMIGTGVFLLPASLASVGGIATFGWIVATAGAVALGLVFAKLGELDPQEGGPYAYARDFLGPSVGFQTNYIYWFGNWIGNIAIAVAAIGYLAEFIPAVSEPPASVFATAGLIWLLTFANIRGPRVIGALETWTMSLALIPILGIAFLGWLWFEPETFRSAGVHGTGLTIVGVLMTIVLFATMSPTIAGQFIRIVDLAVILAVIPYVYASVAVVKVVFDHHLPARTFQTYQWIAIAAVVYCLWTVLGGDPSTVVNAMVALLASVPLYPFFIRSMNAATARKRTGIRVPEPAPHPGDNRRAVAGPTDPAAAPQRA